MSPEVRAELDRLQREIDTLRQAQDPAFIAAIERFSERGLVVSTKTADSENRTVDENGTSSYSVLQEPDGFLTDGNVFVPYYN